MFQFQKRPFAIFTRIRKVLLLQITIFISISLASGQSSYEADYERGNTDNGASESSGYNEEPGDADAADGIDYTKYFNSGSSEPFISAAASEASGEAPEGSSGFVTPLNFGELFEASDFGKLPEFVSMTLK